LAFTADGGLSVQPLETAPVEENEKVVIRAPGFNGRPFSLQASLVRNSLRKGRREWGCEFTIADVSAFQEIVGFVYGDSRRWVQFWEQRKSQQVRISRGFLHLLRIGWKGAIRNFKGVLFPQWQKWVQSTRALPGKVAFALSLRRKILRALFAGLPKPAPAMPTSAEKNG
ncbi:MAG: hypothetical protein NTX30_06585, partial [Deltaproteobacteria bacterium]|nr:hypothetical protein [Deltaproteobacteria bacterium]